MQITKNAFIDFGLPPGTLPPCISACFAPQGFITELERLGKDGFRFLVIWCFGSLVAGSVIAVRRLVEKKVMGFGFRRRQVAGSRVGVGTTDRCASLRSTAPYGGLPRESRVRLEVPDIAGGDSGTTVGRLAPAVGRDRGLPTPGHGGETVNR